jgi:hypothetical protein
MRFLTFLICLMLAGAQCRAQEAVDFHKKMVTVVATMNKRCGLWANQLGMIVDGTRKFIDLKPYRIDIEKYIEFEADILKKTKDVQDSKEYREAVISYLEFEKLLVKNAYIPVEQLKPNVSETQFDAAMAHFTDIAAKEDKYLNKIKTVQNQYTQKNGFVLDTAFGQK